jgi:hypothetical protein
MIYHEPQEVHKSIDRTHPEYEFDLRRNMIPSEVRYHLWYWHVAYNLVFIIVVYAILIDIMASGISPK